MSQLVENQVSDEAGELDEAAQGGALSSSALQRLLNIDVPVSVKLAEKKMGLEAITGLAVGAIIEFDKEAGQELELMIRNKAVGFGKAVKVGENFGLRVTSVVDVHETINALGGLRRGGLVDPDDMVEGEA